MPRALLLSSLVAQGRIGLRANVAPLEASGVDTITLPTIVLSNHPAMAVYAGVTIEPETLTGMIGALEANGALYDLDIVFSGYLPTHGHVEVARVLADAARRHSPKCLYVCDPVMGDDPAGLYMPPDVATGIRDLLIPMADLITPNRFELQWLSGLEVRDADSAIRASRKVGCPTTVATSIPDGSRHLVNVLTSERPPQTAISRTETLAFARSGTGDVFAGLLLSKMAAGAPVSAALGFATAGVAYALRHSEGSVDLQLSGIDWRNGFKDAPVEPCGEPGK